ncbi:13396_t:CDS:2 [Dentiscutata erythropus]|uniref:13396_t:CDS:1 n=1 Tax=Dentiscutata erythropus TaxID=1348616 RepID=A0A9N8VJ34_9GLOM|nr:13396_t:CDS:2 [Dentiscutata erythropus]
MTEFLDQNYPSKQTKEIIMTTAQEFLDQNYPSKQTKEQVKSIDIHCSSIFINKKQKANNLTKGKLDLREFINLEEFITSENAAKMIIEIDVKITDIVLPDSEFGNFGQLKQEIVRLRLDVLTPQFQNKKAELEELAQIAKNKAGDNLEAIVSLLLRTQASIIKRKKGNDSFAQDQLEAFRDILQSKLTSEELKTLLSKQIELTNSEEQLNKLQQIRDQQAAPILHNNH